MDHKLRSYASRSGVCGWPVLTNRGSGGKIVWRTRIRRCDDESAECGGSNRLDPPSAFLSMHAAVHNTFNLQLSTPSSRDRRCVSSEPRRKRMAQCGRGSVITHPGSDCFCSPRVNLTMSAPDLVGGVFGIAVEGRAAAETPPEAIDLVQCNV